MTSLFPPTKIILSRRIKSDEVNILTVEWRYCLYHWCGALVQSPENVPNAELGDLIEKYRGPEEGSRHPGELDDFQYWAQPSHHEGRNKNKTNYCVQMPCPH